MSEFGADDLPEVYYYEEEDAGEEEDVDCCIMCGQPIPIEGFCCNAECLEAAEG